MRSESSPLWKIYYSDGTTFDSTQGGPEDAPWFGVIVILMYDPDFNGRGVLHDDHRSSRENDYYWWNRRDGMWYGGKDTDVLIQFGIHAGILTALKHGETLKNIRYKGILDRAMQDPDFLPASIHDLLK